MRIINPEFKKIVRNCLICNKKFRLKRTIDIERKKFCSRSCKSKFMVQKVNSRPLKLRLESYQKQSLKVRGKNNPYWKGGIYKERDYVLIYNPTHPFCNKKGYVREHRLIVEKQIGRYLHKWEITHHINKIKDDNRPQNLMAFKNIGTHLKFESGKRVNLNEIIFDGRKEIANAYCKTE